MNSLEWPNQASQQNNLYKIWKSDMIFLFFVRYKIIFGLSLLFCTFLLGYLTFISASFKHLTYESIKYIQ